MKNNETKINKVDLIFDNSNGTPILSNRNHVLEVLKRNESNPSKKESLSFVSVKEINDLDSANQWLRPIDYLAIIENTDDKEISQYVKNLERKSEQLYRDLNKIIIEKYNINDEELIKKIKELNAKNDPNIGKYLDLVDDVIYNVEADWNDLHNIENKLNLYDVDIQTKKVSTTFNGQNQIEDLDFEGLKIVDIIAANTGKVDSKDLKTVLETKSADDLYDYINDTTTKLKFVESTLKNSIDLYQMLSSKKEVKHAKKLKEIFEELKGSSETVDRVINSVEQSDEFDVRETFDDSFDAIDNTEEQLKKISKLIKVDEELVALNEEVITLNKVLDVLTSKLAIAYTVAFNNENKFSKRLINRNRSLERKAIEVVQENPSIETTENLNDADVNSSEYKAILEKINSESQIVYDEQFSLFANKKMTSKFRSSLDATLKHLMSLEKSKFTTLDAKEYLMNEYFLFLNSELGIVNDLIDLAGLIELKRINLMTEIAAAEIKFLSSKNIKEKIEFSMQANYETTKILAAEVLVLKAILLHKDVIAVIKAQAKKQCQDLMTIILWDKRLSWWTETTKEVVTEAYFHPVYGKDEGVQYLFNEISKMDDEEEFDELYEECEDDYDDNHSECTSCAQKDESTSIDKSNVQSESQAQPVQESNKEPRKTMVLKFIETKEVPTPTKVMTIKFLRVEKEVVQAPTKVMTIKFLRVEKQEVDKPVKVVEFNYVTPTTANNSEFVEQTPITSTPVEQQPQTQVETITNEKEVKVVRFFFSKPTPVVAPVVNEKPVEKAPEVKKVEETEDERLRRLKRKGMSSAGYRIAALVKETKRELEKEVARVEQEKLEKEQEKAEKERQEMMEKAEISAKNRQTNK